MFLRTLALLLLCLITPWVSADESDHPLLSRYPDAEIGNWLYTEYEKVSLPSGSVDKEGNLPVDTLIGDLTRIKYKIEGVSTFKVVENYRNALKRLGAKLISVCELRECGGKDSGLLDLAAGVAGGRYYVGNYYEKPYFARAKLESVQGDIHIALFVGGYDGNVWVHQVIVEEVASQNTLISVAKDYLNIEAAKALPGDRRTPEEKQEDHPMMARYPGARLSRSRSVEYDKVSLPLSVINPEGTASTKLDLIGDISQYTYQAENVSTLKVYQNYLQAIKKLEFSLEYSCELDGCGGEDASKELGERMAVTGGVENYYRNPYYFVASRDVAQGRVVVAMYFGGFEGDVWIQQAVIEEKGTETDLITVDADQLYQEIQQSGKALVYGIYFDTDSATVKAGSADALKAISNLMQSHPELNLYVVGHTDDTGATDHNQGLSSRRAASVVDALKADHAIESDRLKAAGVGPYAPVAGNDSDEGRRLNRRVELVRRL